MQLLQSWISWSGGGQEGVRRGSGGGQEEVRRGARYLLVVCDVVRVVRVHAVVVVLDLLPLEELAVRRVAEVLVAVDQLAAPAPPTSLLRVLGLQGLRASGLDLGSDGISRTSVCKRKQRSRRPRGQK
eukprot:404361-Prorocentrum_minimum.AAC.2